MVPEDFRPALDSSAEELLLDLRLQEKVLLRDFGKGHPDVIAVRGDVLTYPALLQRVDLVVKGGGVVVRDGEMLR